MQTLVLTFVLFVVVVLLMAAGVMITGRSLRGSCGGPDCVCESEGKPLGSCEYEDPTLPTHPDSVFLLRYASHRKRPCGTSIWEERALWTLARTAVAAPSSSKK